MNITIEGFHGPLPMEVAQRIHYHFPASVKEKNTFVLHMDGARITGEIEGPWMSLKQGGFLQEVASQSQVDIHLVTSHMGLAGRPDTYTFLAQEEKTRLVFREAIDLLTNPKTARRYAELWNEAEMPWEIDMGDPDAPWNQEDDN